MLEKINFKSLKINCQVISSKKTIHKQVEFFSGTKRYLRIRRYINKTSHFSQRGNEHMIILIDAKETFNNTQHRFLKPVLSFRPRVGPFSVNDCLKSQLHLPIGIMMRNSHQRQNEVSTLNTIGQYYFRTVSPRQRNTER